MARPTLTQRLIASDRLPVIGVFLFAAASTGWIVASLGLTGNERKSIMSPWQCRVLLLLLITTTANSNVRAQDAESNPSKISDLHQSLLGAWVLTGPPGNRDQPQPDAELKFWGLRHFAVTKRNAANDGISWHHVGTYTLDGNRYVETITFGMGQTEHLIGETFEFDIEINGDTYVQRGIGNRWTQQWQRLVVTEPARNNQPVQTKVSELHQSLLGGWVLIAEPGTVKVPGQRAAMKFWGLKHWIIMESDLTTGRIMHHHGGTYALDGDQYAETVRFAADSSRELIGTTFQFKINVDKDVYAQTGIGNQFNEAWKRAKAD